jgi:hypothetical protein
VTYAIPSEVAGALSRIAFERKDAAKVTSALSALGVQSNGLRVFFGRYQGPFYSKALGYEMADLCEGSPTVVTLTTVCREQYDWPPLFVVLTDVSGGEALVMNADADAVYRVDFDGGQEELKAGQLRPTWDSFNGFLRAFFGVRG